MMNSRPFTLTLIRGLPGVGKTTLGRALARQDDSEGHKQPRVVAADDFMVGPDGGYRFDPEKLPGAHRLCQEVAWEAIRLRGQHHAGRGIGAAEPHELRERVIVTNTLTEAWEIAPYADMVRRAAANPRPLWVRLEVIDLFDGGFTDAQLAARNVHGVPEAGIAAMRARYEHNWMAGDRRPPWERGTEFPLLRP
jgi:hypothetical protein